MVHLVNPPLVQKDGEHDVVTEAGHLVQCRHFDYESEEVVDEGVKRLVHEELPRQVSNRLEPVVDEELRRHHDEAAAVDEGDERLEQPRPPRAEVARHERVQGVADDEEEERRQQEAEGELVVGVGEGDSSVRLGGVTLPHVERLEDLEDTEDEVKDRGDLDEPARVLLDEVQQDDELHRLVEDERTRREPLHRVDVGPEGDVVLEGEHVEEQVHR
mmetsp:Transcript_4732/g.10320  ORF Transcript_4732/g.10320 Transcript_4732/m.10320 type:complete len:216 (+) Transcript_4732:492-1139(+)